LPNSKYFSAKCKFLTIQGQVLFSYDAFGNLFANGYNFPGKERVMDRNAVLVHERDNVAVAIREIQKGELVIGVAGDKIAALADIPKNHKVALVAIKAGEKIIKYSESIGVATIAINHGDWVHTHNLKAED
jgi:altronate dehydratase